MPKDTKFVNRRDDLICCDLSFLAYKVRREDVSTFIQKANDKFLPDEYIFETLEGFFKINKVKKEFRILKRKQYDDLLFLGYPNKSKVDLEIMKIYKIAKRAGFKVFLENKFSN